MSAAGDRKLESLCKRVRAIDRAIAELEGSKRNLAALAARDSLEGLLEQIKRKIRSRPRSKRKRMP